MRRHYTVAIINKILSVSQYIYIYMEQVDCVVWTFDHARRSIMKANDSQGSDII